MGTLYGVLSTGRALQKEGHSRGRYVVFWPLEWQPMIITSFAMWAFNIAYSPLLNHHSLPAFITMGPLFFSSFYKFLICISAASDGDAHLCSEYVCAPWVQQMQLCYQQDMKIKRDACFPQRVDHQVPINASSQSIWLPPPLRRIMKPRGGRDRMWYEDMGQIDPSAVLNARCVKAWATVELPGGSLKGDHQGHISVIALQPCDVSCCRGSTRTFVRCSVVCLIVSATPRRAKQLRKPTLKCVKLFVQLHTNIHGTCPWRRASDVSVKPQRLSLRHMNPREQ